MKIITLIYACLFLPLFGQGQDVEEMQEILDSLKNEKEYHLFQYKSLEKKIDSLQSNLSRVKASSIEDLISKINQAIGSGIKVELAETSSLSPTPSLNPGGLILESKKIVTLVKRADTACYGLIVFNKYRGYLPIYNLKLPQNIEFLEKKLKKLLGKDYFPTNSPQNLNITPSSSEAKPYSSPSRSNNSPSNCNSVQCIGTTQKGERCKKMTTNCNGRCYLH